MRYPVTGLIFFVVFAGCVHLNTDTPRFEDPEIAMVLRVANLSEVREGELAREKAAEPSVRDFAAMMVNEHSAADSTEESAFFKANIVSDDSPLSRQLDAESGAATERLRALTGRAFDRAYTQRQIEAHQNLLHLIDAKLMPAAHHKVVKEQLKTLRKSAQQHLTRAEQVVKTIPAS